MKHCDLKQQLHIRSVKEQSKIPAPMYSFLLSTESSASYDILLGSSLTCTLARVAGSSSV